MTRGWGGSCVVVRCCARAVAEPVAPRAAARVRGAGRALCRGAVPGVGTVAPGSAVRALLRRDATDVQVIFARRTRRTAPRSRGRRAISVKVPRLTSLFVLADSAQYNYTQQL